MKKLIRYIEKVDHYDKPSIKDFQWCMKNFPQTNRDWKLYYRGFCLGQMGVYEKILGYIKKRGLK